MFMSFTLKNKSKMLLKLNENVIYFLPNHQNIWERFFRIFQKYNLNLSFFGILAENTFYFYIILAIHFLCPKIIPARSAGSAPLASDKDLPKILHNHVHSIQQMQIQVS